MNLVGFDRVTSPENPIRELVITQCPNFKSLDGIYNLQASLQTLIVDNTGLSNTADLANVDYSTRNFANGVLRHLELTNNKGLTEIKGISDATRNIQSIVKLVLRGNSMRSISSITPLRYLEHLDISNNPIENVEELRFLISFPFCRYIDLHNTPVAEKITRGGLQDGYEMPKTLYFCLPRNNINVLIYKGENSDGKLTDEVKAEIYRSQEFPLEHGSNKKLTCFDFYRMWLVNQDSIHLREMYEGFNSVVRKRGHNEDKSEIAELERALMVQQKTYEGYVESESRLREAHERIEDLQHGFKLYEKCATEPGVQYAGGYSRPGLM